MNVTWRPITSEEFVPIHSIVMGCAICGKLWYVTRDEFFDAHIAIRGHVRGHEREKRDIAGYKIHRGYAWTDFYTWVATLPVDMSGKLIRDVLIGEIGKLGEELGRER